MSYKGGDEIELHHEDTSDVPTSRPVEVLDKVGLMEYLTHLQDLENELKIFTFHPRSYLLNDVRMFINSCKDKAKDESFGTLQDLEDYKLPTLDSLYVTIGEKRNPARVMAARQKSPRGRSSSRGSRTSRTSSFRPATDLNDFDSSSEDEEKEAQRKIKIQSQKRVQSNLEEVMGEKFTPAQLVQIKDLMLANNYRNSSLPTSGCLMVEPPTNWPKDSKGRLVENTMTGLSANSQVIRSQLINSQFHQLRKKYTPSSSFRDKRESIIEFLEGVNMSQDKAMLSRKEFRDTFPTLFGGQAYIKVKNMIRNGRTLREIYKALIDSYNTEESEMVARDKLANLRRTDFDSLTALNDEVTRLANIVANNKMSPEVKESTRNELIVNQLLKLVPNEWKLVIEGEISHFKMASYGQDLSGDDLFLILLKYRNGLDEYLYKGYKNNRSKKEVNALKIDSEEKMKSEGKLSKGKSKAKNDKKNKEETVNAVREDINQTEQKQFTKGYNSKSKKKNFGKSNYSGKSSGKDEYCNLCDSNTHGMDGCTLFPKWMRQITQERCKKCTLKGYHLEKYCPAIRFASINSSAKQ